MVHFIVGTRAQLIKIAPVMRVFDKAGTRYNFIFIAQHKETISEMLQDFGLRQPDFVIGNIGHDISHAALMVKWLLDLARRILSAGEAAFKGDRNGIAVVHGDALPALVGAVWAKLNGLKVAHVEAGLRSYDYLHPFPEELIRVSLWRMSLVDICFCPNEWAVNNLSRFSMTKINTQCNTLLDSLRMATEIGERSESPVRGLWEKYGVVSLHRAETLMSKARLTSALNAVSKISETLPLIFVLHPSTRKTLKGQDLLGPLSMNPNLLLHPRLNYFDFMALLKRSEFLITDGGSNQEECSYLGHPCLLLRAVTERVEGVGANVIISDFQESRIAEFVAHYEDYRKPPVTLGVSASEIIFDSLKEFA